MKSGRADRYIGIKITPTTTTGDLLRSGNRTAERPVDRCGRWFSDDDEIPEGPVVDGG